MKDILFVPVSLHNSNNATTETIDREKEEICQIIASLATLTRDELLEFCIFKVNEGVKLKNAYLRIHNANYSLTKTMAKYRHQLHQLTSALEKMNLRPTRFNSSLKSILNNMFEDITNKEINNDLNIESSDIMNLHTDKAKIENISDSRRLKSNTPCSESNAISAASHHINSNPNASDCLGSKMSTAVPASYQLFSIPNAATSIAQNQQKLKPNILSRPKLNTSIDTATSQAQEGSSCAPVFSNLELIPNKTDLKPAVIISNYLNSYLNKSKLKKKPGLNFKLVSPNLKLIKQQNANYTFVSPSLKPEINQQNKNSVIVSSSSKLITNKQNTNSAFISPSSKLITSRENTISAIVSPSSESLTYEQNTNSTIVSLSSKLVTNQQNTNSAFISSNSKLVTNQQGSKSTIDSPCLKPNATLLNAFSMEFIHKNMSSTIAPISASPLPPCIQEEMTNFINTRLEAADVSPQLITVANPLLQKHASLQTDDIIDPQNVMHNITHTPINGAKIKISPLKSTQQPTDLIVSNTVTSRGLNIPLKNTTEDEMPVRLANPPLKMKHRLISVDLDNVITQGLPSGLTTSANKSDNSCLVVNKPKPGDNMSSQETDVPDHQNQIKDIPIDDGKIKICGSLVRVDDPPAEIKIRAKQLMTALRKKQKSATLNTPFKTNSLLRPANLHLHNVKTQGLPSGLTTSANKPDNSYLVVNKRKPGDVILDLAFNESPTKKLATETSKNARRTVIPNITSAISPSQDLFESDTCEASGISHKNITDGSDQLIAGYEKTLTAVAESITFDWSHVKFSKKTQGCDSIKVVETPFKIDQCDSAIVKDTLKPEPTMSMTSIGESVDVEDFLKMKPKKDSLNVEATLKPEPKKSLITFSAAGQACVIKRLNDKKTPNVEDTPETNSVTRVSRNEQSCIIKPKFRPLDMPRLLDEM